MFDETLESQYAVQSISARANRAHSAARHYTTQHTESELTWRPGLLGPVVDPVASASMAGNIGGGGKPNAIRRRGWSTAVRTRVILIHRRAKPRKQEQAESMPPFSAGAEMQQLGDGTGGSRGVRGSS